MSLWSYIFDRPYIITDDDGEKVEAPYTLGEWLKDIATISTIEKESATRRKATEADAQRSTTQTLITVLVVAIILIIIYKFFIKK